MSCGLGSSESSASWMLTRSIGGSSCCVFAEERRQSLDRMAAGARGKAVSARCLTSEQSRQAGQTVHSADAPKSALIWSYPAAAKASESHDCSTQSMSP